MEDTRAHRVFGWIGRHAGIVTVTLLLGVIGLGIAGPIVANTGDADFDPNTEIFAVADRAEGTGYRRPADHPGEDDFRRGRRLAQGRAGEPAVGRGAGVRTEHDLVGTACQPRLT